MKFLLALLLQVPLLCFGAIGQKPVVVVKKIVATELSDQLTYPARFEPKVNAAILAETDGVITKIRKTLGQKVKSGEALLTIQQTDPVYQFAPLSVRTPVTGLVSSLEVTVGSRVTKGQRLGFVTDPQSLRVTVEVPAQDLHLISPGIVGELKLPGQENVIQLRLTGISPHVDLATGTAGAEFETVAKPGDLTLRPGMLGKLQLKVNARQAFAVSEEAVVYRNRQTFVRIIEKGKARSVLVTVGNRNRGQVEILTGLFENADVVERTNGFVGEGEEVEIQTQTQGT